MFHVPGTSSSLPASPLPLRDTSAENAWTPRGYRTIRLTQSIPAMRVHVRAGVGAAFQGHLALGAGRHGRWFAIGDVILTREEYAAAHALPAGFSHQDDWELPIGTVLNVGYAGPLFGHPGGALQAEWISGPPPTVRSIDGYWSSKSGRA